MVSQSEEQYELLIHVGASRTAKHEDNYRIQLQNFLGFKAVRLGDDRLSSPSLVDESRSRWKSSRPASQAGGEDEFKFVPTERGQASAQQLVAPGICSRIHQTFVTASPTVQVRRTPAGLQSFQSVLETPFEQLPRAPLPGTSVRRKTRDNKSYNSHALSSVVLDSFDENLPTTKIHNQGSKRSFARLQSPSPLAKRKKMSDSESDTEYPIPMNLISPDHSPEHRGRPIGIVAEEQYAPGSKTAVMATDGPIKINAEKIHSAPPTHVDPKPNGMLSGPAEAGNEIVELDVNRDVDLAAEHQSDETRSTQEAYEIAAREFSDSIDKSRQQANSLKNVAFSKPTMPEPMSFERSSPMRVTQGKSEVFTASNSREPSIYKALMAAGRVPHQSQRNSLQPHSTRSRQEPDVQDRRPSAMISQKAQASQSISLSLPSSMPVLHQDLAPEPIHQRSEPVIDSSSKAKTPTKAAANLSPVIPSSSPAREAHLQLQRVATDSATALKWPTNGNWWITCVKSERGLDPFKTHVPGQLHYLSDGQNASGQIIRDLYAGEVPSNKSAPAIHDRGCWVFRIPCAPSSHAWSREQREVFWSLLDAWVKAGDLGHVSAEQLNVATMENIGFGFLKEERAWPGVGPGDDWVRLFCWGEAVREIWCALYKASEGRTLRLPGGMRWVIGANDCRIIVPGV